jgi:hypothetical protein
MRTRWSLACLPFGHLRNRVSLAAGFNAHGAERNGGTAVEWCAHCYEVLHEVSPYGLGSPWFGNPVARRGVVGPAAGHRNDH